MTPNEELLRKIIETIDEELPSLPPITVGQLQPEGGIVMQMVGGYNQDAYLNRGFLEVMPLLFLSKSQDQTEAFNWLFKICSTLEGLPEYPSTDTYEWINAICTTSPTYVSREETGKRMFIYSCVIDIQFMIRKEN